MLKYIFSIPLLLIFSCSSTALTPYKRVMKLMGTRFEITVVANNKIEGDKYIDEAVAEITRIEKLISSWDQKSQTSEINKNAGLKAVKVDLELINLIERALGLSKMTDGAFDISYASMDRIWKFDGSVTQLPSQEIIAASVAKIGYRNVIIDKEHQTVFLKKKGMKIGFGGIGKGYAADKAKDLLISHGVVSGIINASGDMNTWGKQPNGKDWKVAITNPFDKTKSYGLMSITDGAVVTSGNYEKFITIDGKRYAHIIDPRTGFPSTGIISVTVFAPKAELADALATSIFVMGVDAGIDRINQLNKVECIIIEDNGKCIQLKKH